MASPMIRTAVEGPNGSAVSAGTGTIRRGRLCRSVAKWSWCLAWLGLVLLAGAGVLLWHLQAHGVAVRLIVVERLADVVPQSFGAQDSDLLAREFPGRDPVDLLRAVMNGVTRVGPDPSGRRQAVPGTRQGGRGTRVLRDGAPVCGRSAAETGCKPALSA